MVASKPARRRRRPRRDSLERPVNGRLYRNAFLVLLPLPLLLLALTITTPQSLEAPQLPPAFDSQAAMTLTRDLVAQHPNRVPGSSGGLGAAQWLKDTFAAYDFTVHSDRWQEQIPGLGRVQLENLTAVVPGQSPNTIVVMAHRDGSSKGPGANDNATGTAALVELARVYGRPQTTPQGDAQSMHTIVFLSTDGGVYGGLGAARFAARSPSSRRIVAVINLDSLAGPGPPRIEIAGDEPRSPSSTLVQTTSQRILEQVGQRPGHPSLVGQLIDLGFPLTLYEQGPFIARGIPAITLTTNQTRPQPTQTDTPDRLDQRRFAQMGAAAQELLGSLDQGLELAQETTTQVWVGEFAVRGWAIELVLVALLIPFFVATVDLYARSRRSRIELAPALRALRSRLGFWLFVAIVFTCFRIGGAWPEGAARPPNPDSSAVGDWPAIALTVFGLIVLAGWLVTRQRLAPRRHITVEEQFAGHLVALLALGVLALLVVATNPFALLFVLPALHAWLWLPQVQTMRLPARLTVLAIGFLGPCIVLFSLAWRFGLGGDAPWYLIVLVSLGYVSTIPVLIGLAGAAMASQLAAVAAGRYAPYPGKDERGPRGPIRNLIRGLVLAVRAHRAQRREAAAS